MLLVSWNVAGRVKRLAEQAEALISLHADVVCLQEVTPSTLPRWRSRLQEAGYAGVAHGELPSRGRTRPLVVLTASRMALHAVLVDGVPWPERVLAVYLSDGTEVVNVHSPTAPSLTSPRFGHMRRSIATSPTSRLGTRESSAAT